MQKSDQKIGDCVICRQPGRVLVVSNICSACWGTAIRETTKPAKEKSKRSNVMADSYNPCGICGEPMLIQNFSRTCHKCSKKA